MHSAKCARSTKEQHIALDSTVKLVFYRRNQDRDNVAQLTNRKGRT